MSIIIPFSFLLHLHYNQSIKIVQKAFIHKQHQHSINKFN